MYVPGEKSLLYLALQLSRSFEVGLYTSAFQINARDKS